MESGGTNILAGVRLAEGGRAMAIYDGFKICQDPDQWGHFYVSDWTDVATDDESSQAAMDLETS